MLQFLPLLGVAANLLPSLTGMLLGNKAASVTEKVVAAAKEVFGTTDADDIQLQISQDATKAEMFKAKLEQETAMYRIQVEDTVSARARDVEVRKMSGGTNPRSNIMLVGTFVSLVGILWGTILYRADIPDGVLALMNMTAGALVGCLVQAFNFEFGSSRGSSEKTDQIANVLHKLT